MKPSIQPRQPISRLDHAEVVPPAAQKHTQVRHDALYAPSRAAPRKFSDPLLQALDRLPVEPDQRSFNGVGKGEPQELTRPGVIHAAFVGVDLQPHPPGDKPRDALKHSFASPPASPLCQAPLVDTVL